MNGATTAYTRDLAAGGAIIADGAGSAYLRGTGGQFLSRETAGGSTSLLTDRQGRPVAIRVFPGNTADPTAFTEAVELVRVKFGLRELTLVGTGG